MSVSLNPSSSLGFKRPLTVLVKRSLTITNHNSQPIAFKVKTTAPKLYCVRPNSGRVDPGESVDVSVMLQPLREEPPLNAKCKDKFLIQSTLITAEKETMPLHDIWATPEGKEEARVHQQKLRVTYLPAEGQTLEEEDDEHHIHQPQPQPLQLQPQPSMVVGDSRFDTDTVRQHPIANGHPDPIPDLNEPQQQDVRPNTPPGDFSVARENSHDESILEGPSAAAHDLPPPSPLRQTIDRELEPTAELAHEPEPSHAPPSVTNTIPAPIHFNEAPDAELVAKYEAAQAEIDRLRAALSTMSEAPPTELRRRNRAMSDDGSVAETDVATTVIDDGYLHQQEGVPLQVVVIIALGVFITTYLFF